MLITIFIIFLFWFIFVYGSFIYFVIKYRRMKPTAKYDIYREIPDNYGPEILGYLIDKNNIKTKYFIASILELIRRKILVIKNDSNNVFLIDNDKNMLIKMTSAEKKLKNIIINVLGNGNYCSIERIKSICYETDYNYFFKAYFDWSQEVVKIGSWKGFYYFPNKGKMSLSILGLSILISIILLFFLFNSNYSFLCSMLVAFILISMLLILIIIDSKKCITQKGIDELEKWKGFKRFLKEFSNLNDKNTYDVFLRDKYLVYAIALGVNINIRNELGFDMSGQSLNDFSSISYMIYNYEFCNKLNSFLENNLQIIKK